MLLTRTTSETPIFTPPPEVLSKNRRTKWTNVCLAIAFALCLVDSANADFVTGRVYDPDGNILKNKAFTVDGKNINFKTDGSGNFSLYLDPGTYKVHQSDDRSVEGIVHGYPQSAQEDIHLKKR
jgi:hypothetical protein